MNNNERTGEGSANRGDETDLDSGDEASEDDRRERARRKYRHRTYSEFEGVHFKNVNERVVSDITLEAVYKPHTLFVLVLLCTYLIYAALTTGPDSTANNVYTGLVALFCLFVVISAMVLPNGPFIRPHPIFWRIVFGVSILYALLLQFTLYQNYEDVKAVLSWLDPVGLSHRNLSEKMYAENCSDITLARIWSCVDIFAFAHFTGWAMKALLIRHSIICWYISIWWELTEIVFSHMLPNFQECWWDAIVLDVLLCNGLGIYCGLWICRWLEMRQFHWESIKNIRTFRGKLMRSVMQFTPESWITVNWLQGTETIAAVEHKKEEGKTHISMPWMGVKRCFAIYAFIMVWLTTELNIFFTKHVLVIDTSHPLVFGHIIFIGLIAAPTIRQYYMYVTDPMIKRMGMQCWLYVAICALEAAICVKFGRAQLPAVKLWLIMLWILFLAIGTFFCVWVSVWWAKYSKTRSVELMGGGKRECYSDSSTASHSGGSPSSGELRQRHNK